MFRLVVEHAHAQRAAERPAERGEGEERALRDAPFARAGLRLVDAHGGEGDDVDGGEVEKEIAHRRPPFPRGGCVPLPPERGAPGLADVPDRPGLLDLADFPALPLCAARADAGFLPPP